MSCCIPGRRVEGHGHDRFFTRGEPVNGLAEEYPARPGRNPAGPGALSIRRPGDWPPRVAAPRANPLAQGRGQRETNKRIHSKNKSKNREQMQSTFLRRIAFIMSL